MKKLIKALEFGNLSKVEISFTDARSLGLNPPVRLSGNVEGRPGAILKTERSQVNLQQGVIVAQRHIHMTPEDAERRGVADKQTVRLQVFTQRPLIFEDVQIRVSPKFATYVHLDYDEANAGGFVAGDLGRILP